MLLSRLAPFAMDIIGYH